MAKTLTDRISRAIDKHEEKHGNVFLSDIFEAFCEILDVLDEARLRTSIQPPKPTLVHSASDDKLPSGVFSRDEVCAMIRKLALHPSYGKNTALDLLSAVGGVGKVSDLKPENFDKVAAEAVYMMTGLDTPAMAQHRGAAVKPG